MYLQHECKACTLGLTIGETITILASNSLIGCTSLIIPHDLPNASGDATHNSPLGAWAPDKKWAYCYEFVDIFANPAPWRGALTSNHWVDNVIESSLLEIIGSKNFALINLSLNFSETTIYD